MGLGLGRVVPVVVLGPLGHRQRRHQRLRAVERGLGLRASAEPGPAPALYAVAWMNLRAAGFRRDLLRGPGDVDSPPVAPVGAPARLGFQAPGGGRGVPGLAGELRGGAQVLRITVPGGVPPQRTDALLAVASYCTVHNTLRQQPDVSIELAGAS